MDWQRGLVGWACLVCLACGSQLSGKPLLPGQAPSTPALALQSKILAKNALAYRVAMSDSYLASVELTTEFRLVVRDLANSHKKHVRLDSATYDITGLALDETHAYVSSSAGWVRSYDLRSLQLRREWRFGSGATALAITDDHIYLFIGTQTGLICLRRLSDGAQLQCMVAHSDRVSTLDTKNDQLASASWNGEVATWGIPTLENHFRRTMKDSVADLAFSPDARLLAITQNLRPPLRSQALNDAEKRGDSDPEGANRIEIYTNSRSSISNRPVHRLSQQRSTISSLCWIGNDLLTASWDHTVQLWNTSAGSPTATLSKFAHIVQDLACRAHLGTFAVAAWAPGKNADAIHLGKLLY